MLLKVKQMSDHEFNSILTENADYLKPFAFNLTKDQEKAKDLVQETLHRALVNKEKYHAGTNLKAWIYTIMRNIFINDFRKNSRYNIVHDTSENSFLLNNIKSTGNSAEVNLALKDIWRFINQLPDIFRNPFVMYYEGYKYNEIAEVLTLPLGTIKSRIHFSRKMLREQILKS